MMSPPDPFAVSFDSIPVDRTTRDSAAGETLAIGAHHCTDEADAPHPLTQAPDAPGYYLLDDANGRFSIDRETGIVTLQHEHLLSIEAGAVHPVRIRVVEMSGARYELKFRLRMTGRVPQIAGAEENDVLAGLAAAPLVDLMSPHERRVHEVVAPEPAPLPWHDFSAARTHIGKRPLYGETAPFGALFAITARLPDVYAETGKLWLDEALPTPTPIDAAWNT